MRNHKYEKYPVQGNSAGPGGKFRTTVCPRVIRDDGEDVFHLHPVPFLPIASQRTPTNQSGEGDILTITEINGRTEWTWKCSVDNGGWRCSILQQFLYFFSKFTSIP